MPRLKYSEMFIFFVYSAQCIYGEVKIWKSGFYLLSRVQKHPWKMKVLFHLLSIVFLHLSINAELVSTRPLQKLKLKRPKFKLKTYSSCFQICPVQICFHPCDRYSFSVPDGLWNLSSTILSSYPIILRFLWPVHRFVLSITSCSNLWKKKIDNFFLVCVLVGATTVIYNALTYNKEWCLAILSVFVRRGSRQR